ncbi:MAG: hypothetical protein QGG42_11015 [Phycisphaerae bacterium]|nr:hypothetical protein [Phycisphaerae bacterium]
MTTTLSRRRSLSALTLASACVAVFGGVCLAGGPPTRLEIPAWSFNRGNARVEANRQVYADYRDMHPNLMIVGGRSRPWEVQYDVDIPIDATYALSIRYASPESRPIEIWIDGKKVSVGCRGATGLGGSEPYLDRFPRHDRPRLMENFHGARWSEACKRSISAGKHTFKLTSRNRPPGVLALRLDSSKPFPAKWKPTGPAVIDPQSGSLRYKARHRYNLAYGRPDPKMKLDRIPPLHRTGFLPPGSVNVAALGMAIKDVTAEFGPRYSKGSRYLKQLAELEKNESDAQEGGPEQLQVLHDESVALRRNAMLDHPLLKFDKLLFVKRLTDTSGHIYEDHYGGKVMGGNLCILSPVAPDGKVTEIAPQLTGGRFGRFDLSFDAKRIVFTYKKDDKSNFRIYEIGVDGKGLRQLSFDAPDESRGDMLYGCKSGRLGVGYDDIDPCYLPSGKIMFASTRTQRVVFCLGTSVTTLHVMDADGKNLHSISEGPITEIDPCVMDDGRVIYMRWEYVDKGFGNVQSLWSMHPDGSHTEHVYKNNVVLPGGMVDPRSVPGSGKIVTIATAHCGLSVGPVVLLDTRKTRRGAEAMTNITPEIALPGMFWHRRTTRYGYFKEPYPLSEKLFIVAHSTSKNMTEPKGYGLYVLDAWGNRVELYRDPETSCFQPVPLRARRKPTEIPSVVGARAKLAQLDKTKDRKLATLFMQDVYRGMGGIKRGRVKYLRIMEAMALPWKSALRSRQQGDAADLQASAVSFMGDVHLKKVFGVVPVEEDGSAYFTVPARKNLYFQALDADYMELQRMRTFVNMIPGEKRSCVGCHELRREAPVAGKGSPLALKHKPSRITPQPGDTAPRMVHYPRDIQPIFDKHCIKCHSGANPKGDLDLSGELTRLWNRSYENLVNKELISFLYGCIGEANVPAEMPLTFGSHRSKLVDRIRNKPCKSNLTREEFIRIVTWIDANAPYYGTHRGKKNIKWKEYADFRPPPPTGK